MHPFPSIQIAGLQLRPKSRGSISLQTPNPRDAPAIRANYLSDPDDQAAILRTLKLIRTVAGEDALADQIVSEKMPGPAVVSDEDLLRFIRAESQSYYHRVGTCKMGKGAYAVVDERLRVHGIARLRVVDATAMPSIVGGNTNALVMMIAEKAADIVLEDFPGS